MTFTVRAIISPDHYARIDVQDNGGPWNQGMIDPIRHHGLDIVRVVADEWGIDGDNTIRTIWARFDCPEQPEPGLRRAIRRSLYRCCEDFFTIIEPQNARPYELDRSVAAAVYLRHLNSATVAAEGWREA